MSRRRSRALLRHGVNGCTDRSVSAAAVEAVPSPCLSTQAREDELVPPAATRGSDVSVSRVDLVKSSRAGQEPIDLGVSEGTRTPDTRGSQPRTAMRLTWAFAAGAGGGVQQDVVRCSSMQGVRSGGGSKLAPQRSPRRPGSGPGVQDCRNSLVAPNAICRSRGRTRSSSSLSQASSPLRRGHDHLEPWRSGA
jgi:hypothetical protein